MQVIEVVQGTPEWLAARAGNVTASKIADVMAKPRGKSDEAATRRNYKAQLVAERLTGQPQENGYVSQEMKDGTEREPLARAAYEIERDVMVEQVGLVMHPTIPNYGASPDGLIGGYLGMEIKCPKMATHIEWLLAGVVPAEHQLQMLSGMDCCERDEWEFVSYCPSMPQPLQLFIRRLHRDDQRIAAIRDAVEQFNAEVQELVDKLKRL